MAVNNANLYLCTLDEKIITQLECNVHVYR